MMTMASYRMRSTVEENRLGFVWFVLRPSLDALIYGVVFGILQGASRPPNYVAYVVTGVFLFSFFKQSFTDGAQSIVSSRTLVQSLAFPRVTLPLSRVVEDLLGVLPAMAILPFILLIVHQPPRVSWLLMIPLLLIYFLFNAGMAMIAARLTVHMRDLNQMVPVISRVLFYSSGVLFNVNTIFKHHPKVITLYDYHPLYQVLSIARGLMLGNPYPLHYWLYFTAFSVVAFVGGLVFFWRAEELYGRQ